MNINESNEQSTRFHNWLSNRTQADFDLQIKCFSLEEEYFEDMAITDQSPLAKFFFEFDNKYDFVPRTLDDKQAIFRVAIPDESEPDVNAVFNREECSITISPKRIKDDSTILHELIHFYEYSLSLINPALNEILLLYLYNKLKPLIPDLDARINDNTDLCSLDLLEKSGGKHGVLFQLKSYDLDIRCKYPLGTVFGYGNYAK